MRYLAIVSLVALGAVGVPVPVPLVGVLIGAGVLAARGEFCVILLVAFVAMGAIFGDTLGYAAGRIGARFHARRQLCAPNGTEERPSPVPRRIARLVRARAVRSAIAWSSERLDRGGSLGALILLTRTVLGAFAPAVNVLSGVRGYPVGRFLLYDAAGELIWVGASLGAGFVAGTHGHDARQYLTHPLVITLTTLFTLVPLLMTLRRPPRPRLGLAEDATRQRTS